MAELYSIAGLLCESSSSISPWGGYFIRAENSSPPHIEGMLIDTVGPSKIDGFMDDDIFYFNKLYGPENQGILFTYEFDLNEKGLWIGEFKQVDMERNKGPIICRTSLFNSDIRTSEGQIGAVFDSMIQRGQLEKVIDGLQKKR